MLGAFLPGPIEAFGRAMFPIRHICGNLIDERGSVRRPLLSAWSTGTAQRSDSATRLTTSSDICWNRRIETQTRLSIAMNLLAPASCCGVTTHNS